MSCVTVSTKLPDNRHARHSHGRPFPKGRGRSQFGGGLLDCRHRDQARSHSFVPPQLARSLLWLILSLAFSCAVRLAGRARPTFSHVIASRCVRCPSKNTLPRDTWRSILTGRFQPLVPKTSASEGNPCGRLEEVALWEMSSWFAATLRRQLRAMFRWRGVTLPQVFFDVDDTVTCSGGAIGGVHEAGYWGEVYPGAAQFILELGRGSRRWMRGVCPPLPRQPS